MRALLAEGVACLPATLAAAMVIVLGGQPAPLPYGQLAVGLSTGIITGAEHNWPSCQAQRIQAVE